MTEDKLMTVPEVAKLLGVSPGTIFHWSSSGTLPFSCVRLIVLMLCAFERETLKLESRSSLMRQTPKEEG